MFFFFGLPLFKGQCPKLNVEIEPHNSAA